MTKNNEEKPFSIDLKIKNTSPVNLKAMKDLKRLNNKEIQRIKIIWDGYNPDLGDNSVGFYFEKRETGILLEIVKYGGISDAKILSLAEAKEFVSNILINEYEVRENWILEVNLHLNPSKVKNLVDKDVNNYSEYYDMMIIEKNWNKYSKIVSIYNHYFRKLSIEKLENAGIKTRGIFPTYQEKIEAYAGSCEYETELEMEKNKKQISALFGKKELYFGSYRPLYFPNHEE